MLDPTADRARALRRVRAMTQKTVANGCTAEEAFAAQAMALDLIFKHQIGDEELHGIRRPRPQPQSEASTPPPPPPQWPRPERRDFRAKRRGVKALISGARNVSAIFCGLWLLTALWILTALFWHVVQEMLVNITLAVSAAAFVVWVLKRRWFEWKGALIVTAISFAIAIGVSRTTGNIGFHPQAMQAEITAIKNQHESTQRPTKVTRVNMSDSVHYDPSPREKFVADVTDRCFKLHQFDGFRATTTAAYCRDVANDVAGRLTPGLLARWPGWTDGQLRALLPVLSPGTKLTADIMGLCRPVGCAGS